MKAQVLLCECCECCGAALDASAASSHAGESLRDSSSRLGETRPRAVTPDPLLSATETTDPLESEADDGPALEFSGAWGVTAMLIVAASAAIIIGAAMLAALLCALGLFLVGTLVIVGAHVSAAAQEDGVGESEPVRARTRAEAGQVDDAS